MILGIDPGEHTGVAQFEGGVLVDLRTVAPLDIFDLLATRHPTRVVFEDSRLTSHLFTTVAKRPVALNMARKVGQVDAWCKLISASCERLGINCHGISPKAKGVKVNAAEFRALTGWIKSSNSHERDAAMVAWPFRRAR